METPREFAERPYQREARLAIEQEFASRDATIIEMATGLGKTEIFTQLMDRWGGRCLVAAPLITLVGQAAKKIQSRTGVMPGIEQADLWSDETPMSRSRFVVASKDTLISGDPKRYTRIKNIGLVIIDECHLSITSSWKELISHFREQGAKILGVTATARRHDKRAMSQVYQSCCYQYGIVEATRDGWLVPARSKTVQLETLDLKGIGSSRRNVFGNDFSLTELRRRLEDSRTILEISEVTARETEGMKTVIYCASVNEAKEVAERLEDAHGINAGWICADTSRCPETQRRLVLDGFAHGDITHVCNVGILTTGWDFPGLECIVMARPTRSLSLYTQIFGRGTRPLPGTVDFDNSTPMTRKKSIANSDKSSFLMIDLVDASLQHKIRTSVDVMVGTDDEEIIMRAKQFVAESTEDRVEVEEAVREARAIIKARRDEEARIQRAKLDVYAEYRMVDVDPHGKPTGEVKFPKRGARFVFGRYKGWLVKETPTWYLTSCQNGRPRISMPWLSKAIDREMDFRNGRQHEG